MTRPEHVRCENCCFWESEWLNKPDESVYGACRRLPPLHNIESALGESEAVTPNEGYFFFMPHDGWCGEFRETWPGCEGPSPGDMALLRMLVGEWKKEGKLKCDHPPSARVMADTKGEQCGDCGHRFFEP